MYSISRSPRELVEEIILVDDASEHTHLGEDLENYVKTLSVPGWNRMKEMCFKNFTSHEKMYLNWCIFEWSEWLILNILLAHVLKSPSSSCPFDCLECSYGSCTFDYYWVYF